MNRRPSMAINAVDESMFLVLSLRPILKQWNCKYFGWTSEKLVMMLGQYVTKVLVWEIKFQAPMVVFEGRREFLLSYQTEKLLHQFYRKTRSYQRSHKWIN